MPVIMIEDVFEGQDELLVGPHKITRDGICYIVSRWTPDDRFVRYGVYLNPDDALAAAKELSV